MVAAIFAVAVLALEYRYSPEFNQAVTIQPYGYVNLTVAGMMHVVGMTAEEAHGAIIAKTAMQLNHPELNLVLKEFQKPLRRNGGRGGAPFTFHEGYEPRNFL
jgi:polysaccharide export outer membrane protein